jgi:phenylacetate-coenzyme A ligase PaaK-like adenylate-forming protein
MNRLDYLRNELCGLDRMDAKEYREMVDSRFRSHVLHHYMNSRDYRELLLKESGIRDEGQLPSGLSEIGRLPTTTREWLESISVHENASVPPGKIRKIIETSGSTGNPFLLPYSDEASLRMAGENYARALIMQGLDTGKTIYSVLHWIPGVRDDWASHEICTLYMGLGGRCIDESTQTPLQKHLENIIESGSEYAASGPAFFSGLAGLVAQRGLKGSLRLKRIFAGGGAVSDSDHDLIKDVLGVESYMAMYASTEAFIMAAQTEGKGSYCTFSDRNALEIVDGGLNPVKDGETGTVLVTPFFMDSAPIIRYVQGDKARYLGERAPEGYSKFAPLIDDIRRFKDATIGDGLISFHEIEHMPDHMREKGAVALGVQLARKRRGLKDVPVIRLEVPPGQDPARIREAALYAFRKNSQMDYLCKTGEIHPPEVEISGPGELRGKNFKIKLFVDEAE